MKKQSNKQNALYVRVAHADDYAEKVQENGLKAYAKENGYTKLKMYTDNGTSGLSLDRPAFNKLQADIESGLIETVIVKNFTRIGRNIHEVGQWIEKTTKKGIKVISIIEPNGFFYTETNFDVLMAAYQKFMKGGACK